jgi:hypothetical protein
VFVWTATIATALLVVPALVLGAWLLIGLDECEARISIAWKCSPAGHLLFAGAVLGVLLPVWKKWGGLLARIQNYHGDS